MTEQLRTDIKDVVRLNDAEPIDVVVSPKSVNNGYEMPDTKYRAIKAYLPERDLDCVLVVSGDFVGRPVAIAEPEEGLGSESSHIRLGIEDGVLNEGSDAIRLLTQAAIEKLEAESMVPTGLARTELTVTMDTDARALSKVMDAVSALAVDGLVAFEPVRKLSAVPYLDEQVALAA